MKAISCIPPGDSRRTALLLELEARGVAVERRDCTSAPDRIVETGFDLADLRGLPSFAAVETVGRFPPETAILLHADLFDREESMETVGPLLTERKLFIAFEPLYDPVSLELRRHIALGTLGGLRSGRIRLELDGRRRRKEAVLAGLDIVSFLSGSRFQELTPVFSGDGGVSIRMKSGSLSLDLDLELAPDGDDPGRIGLGCSLEFSGGLLEIIPDSPVLRFITDGGRTWNGFAAEGTGTRYLALDLVECLVSGRTSGILDPASFFLSRERGLETVGRMSGQGDAE